MSADINARIDLHVHSHHSKDGKGTVLEHAHAAKAAGIDGFAITDHDTTAGHRFIEEAEEATGMMIVPGIEVTTTEGHLLAIGVWERVEPGRGIAETTASIHELGGAAVAAHPFRLLTGIGPTGLHQRFTDGYLDAAETHNGRDRRIVQRNTARIVQGFGCPSVGGSDAHAPRDVGASWTRFHRPVEAYTDVVALLKDPSACIGEGGNLTRRRVWGHAMGAVLRIRRKPVA